MSTEFDKTFDKKLDNLENSVTGQYNSKNLMIKIGIISVISAVLLYVIKPLHILDIKYDEKTKKNIIKLNIPYYIITILVSTMIVYFSLNLYYKFAHKF